MGEAGARLGVGGIQFIAGIGVSLFIICSGYGLEASYGKCGMDDFLKKRLLKVCVPFWIVELIGLIAIGEFAFKDYILDALFIKQTTAYGWFMQYIVICYIIFFIVKKLMEQIGFIKDHEMAVFLTVFVLWFVIDSVIFANPDMPFLKARQMFCFPTGILIAKYKEQIIEKLEIKKANLALCGGGIVIATFLMAITQTGAVKAMPYLVSNLLSLGTCYVYALVVLVIGYWIPQLFQSWTLFAIGTIYLVHAFTLTLVENNVTALALFIVLTLAGAIVLHLLMKKGFSYVRFNNYCPHQE